MKEQIRTPEKELSNKEIANLSDAEFETLVIRMLTELIELSCKMKEEIKATQSEVKQNVQGTNSEEWFGTKGRKEHPTGIETRIQNNEQRLRNLWDNFKHYNIWIIGVPEEEDEQGIENYLKK